MPGLSEFPVDPDFVSLGDISEALDETDICVFFFVHGLRLLKDRDFLFQPKLLTFMAIFIVLPDLEGVHTVQARWVAPSK